MQPAPQPHGHLGAHQPTYHFPAQSSQPPQHQTAFIRSHHFSHVTSASGISEPKKVARVQPQIQSQQSQRSMMSSVIGASSSAPSISSSSSPSSSRPSTVSSSGSSSQQVKCCFYYPDTHFIHHDSFY